MGATRVCPASPAASIFEPCSHRLRALQELPSHQNICLRTTTQALRTRKPLRPPRNPRYFVRFSFLASPFLRLTVRFADHDGALARSFYLRCSLPRKSLCPSCSSTTSDLAPGSSSFSRISSSNLPSRRLPHSAQCLRRSNSTSSRRTASARLVGRWSGCRSLIRISCRWLDGSCGRYALATVRRATANSLEWQDLNVVHASDYNLHRLVSTLTLTNARLTHSVSLGSIPGFDEYYDYNRPCDAVEHGRITPRRTLLTTLIERLRDLVRLSFDVSLARGLSRSHVEQMSSSLVSSSSISRIQELEITSDKQRDSVELDDFSCFIDNLPHLRHLTIHFRENSNVRLHSFSLAVASLRYLQVLELLDSAYLVGERWKLSTWPWTCPSRSSLLGKDPASTSMGSWPCSSTSPLLFAASAFTAARSRPRWAPSTG